MVWLQMQTLQIFSNLDKTMQYTFSTNGHVLTATLEFHYAAKETCCLPRRMQ